MTSTHEADPLAAPLARAERIRIARDLRGYTQLETVERMPTPVSTAALSQIEAGKVRASPQTVHDLAVALGVPVGFFTARRTSLPAPYFRDLRATPARERRRAAAFALVLHDLVLAIEKHVQLPDVRLADYSLPPSASRDEVEEVADAIRGEWDLGDKPIRNMVREIERHGVPVARLDLGHQSVDAFAAWFTHRPLVLLSADKSSYVRSRFDAAHELGHLLMHRNQPPGSKVLERQAHEFAACLLLPSQIAAAALPRRVDSQGWLALAELKQTWGVSMSALLMRARGLDLVSPDAYRNAMKYMSMRGWRKAEPGDRELGLPESPVLIDRALKTIQADLGLSLSDLAEEAQLPEKDARQLVAALLDRRPSVEV